MFDEDKATDDPLCPFCRTPAPSPNVWSKRLKKRAEMNDAEAIFTLLRVQLNSGSNGFPRNPRKACELWHRAAKLGLAQANYNLGYAYDDGSIGVELDKEKARHYWNVAAVGGHVNARCNLSYLENKVGNTHRALKHYMIAARGGQNASLKKIRELYMGGYATKDDFAQALRSHQEYVGEVRSVQRDQAAAADNNMRYVLVDF